jgi:tRNA-dihydrouridine synthase A
VPPLNYPLVRRLKESRTGLEIVLNGGLTGMAQIQDALAWVDGVMLGRAAYHDPALLGFVDRDVFGSADVVSADEALDAFEPYMARALEAGVPLIAMTRHMLGLYQGARGARSYRRIMSDEARKPGAGLDTVRRARSAVSGASQAA